MPDTKNNGTVPDTYQGREQAYIKHRLLEGYLEKLFLIVGMSSSKLGITELCYVDCFAGPWGDESEDMSSHVSHYLVTYSRQMPAGTSTTRQKHKVSGALRGKESDGIQATGALSSGAYAGRD